MIVQTVQPLTTAKSVDSLLLISLLVCAQMATSVPLALQPKKPLSVPSIATAFRVFKQHVQPALTLTPLAPSELLTAFPVLQASTVLPEIKIQSSAQLVIHARRASMMLPRL